jgi:hypothetical protein
MKKNRKKSADRSNARTNDGITLAFFGYSWNLEHRLDAYMEETVQSLLQAGVNIDFYYGNQLSKEFGIYGVADVIDLASLEYFFKSKNYAAAISFNNSMLIPEVVRAIRGKIATVIVDDLSHVFDNSRTGPYGVFRQNIEIVAMSSALERQLLANVEDVAHRLHFMLPATHLDRPPVTPGQVAEHPISWVASLVGDENLRLYLNAVAEHPAYYELTGRCLTRLARDGHLRSIEEENGADFALIKEIPWSFEYFTAQLLNVLTNRSRVEVVERLAPHGLALWGNAEWKSLLVHNAAVFTALQPEALTRHADLRRVYNASKISINMPQAHVANDAVQYRVIDVMASNALMITQYNEDSDLYRVFGEDCPIPTYDTLTTLERLCVHYLNNETERRALVERCQTLVAEGFSFRERATKLLDIVGVSSRADSTPGRLKRIDLRAFLTPEELARLKAAKQHASA